MLREKFSLVMSSRKFYYVQFIKLVTHVSHGGRAGDRGMCAWLLHVGYKDNWEEAIGKELPCEREPRNVKDWYAVAVIKDSTVVRHLPRSLSPMFDLSAKRKHCLLRVGQTETFSRFTSRQP